ncbi:MAG: T9SS type A sorting domain-containing protein [Ignavibacteriaceae bacterium]|nr:T9SS type A sorting domain-containing protein [Ignavibacteriaceae bacterium]
MDWERIGYVEGHGTTTETQVYSFIDKNLLGGKYNYRLKQIDFDGTFENSNAVEVEVTSPTTFSLEQNYPNPFNPTTKISWQSPVGSHQILKIYDVLGNEVATLVDEYREAGSYSVEFNAGNLTSGMYVYRLSTNNFVDTKKLILLK